MHIETHKNFLESWTYSEVNIGDSSTLVRTLRAEDVKLFAIMSGDMNPAIGDLEYSNSGMFREVVAHGMWSASLISTVLGTQFPGPGTVLVDQSLRFMHAVRLGDTLTITVTAKQKFEHNHHVVFDCNCVNQDGMPVVLGTAEVLAPAEKIRTRRVDLPGVTISDKDSRLQALIARAKGLPAIDMAVVHPCDIESLKGALMSA